MDQGSFFIKPVRHPRNKAISKMQLSFWWKLRTWLMIITLVLMFIKQQCYMTWNTLI